MKQSFYIILDYSHRYSTYSVMLTDARKVAFQIVWVSGKIYIQFRTVSSENSQGYPLTMIKVSYRV